VETAGIFEILGDLHASGLGTVMGSPVERDAVSDVVGNVVKDLIWATRVVKKRRSASK
jgi:hypothetical protein